MPITLRDDQLEAIEKMHNGCILCGETGSGKSLVSLAYYYINNGGTIKDGQMKTRMVAPRDLYIITTAAKRDSCEWDSELLALNMSQEKWASSYPDTKVVIDSWNNIRKYWNVENAFFIFDEQKVIGYGAWTKAFLAITSKNSWVLLSATPADKWEDYAPVFLANGFYRNISAFRREHLVYNQHVNYPLVTRYLGEYRLKKLRDSILVDIPYLPTTVEHHSEIIVPFNKDQYIMILKERKSPWETVVIEGKTFNVPFKNASEMCFALRKASILGQERIDEARRICSERNRVIIFYNFDFELDELLSADWGDKIVYQRNGHKHDVLPTDNESHWVYLVQYNSGAEAWNCITTDTMIFFSESYSYRQMHQACGRINRSNTRYVDLYYYHLRTTSSIDEQIKKTLSNKKQFNANAFFRRWQIPKFEKEQKAA